MKALHHTGGAVALGSAPITNSMNMEFSCDGTESNLNACPHKLIPQSCDADALARLICVSKEISIKAEKNQFEGRVFIGGLPVCSQGWTERHSDLICAQMHGPGSRSLRTESRDLASGLSLTLQCQEKDFQFSKCDIAVRTKPCLEDQAFIVCSPCNRSVILDRVQKVMKAAKSVDNTLEDMMR